MNLRAGGVMVVAAVHLVMLQAQLNTGSSGKDGVLHPEVSTVIDLSDHPDGVFHYRSVHVPPGVTVRFRPNAANTPVVWLVQDDCRIEGTVDLGGEPSSGRTPGNGGPGGYRGGLAPPEEVDPITGHWRPPGPGMGPGGGQVAVAETPAMTRLWGGAGSYGKAGERASYNGQFVQHLAGEVYGNPFLLPLLGGSGGSGGISPPVWDKPLAGGGGGGAILIACSGLLEVNGSIQAVGGAAGGWGGAGSGGAIRLVASTITGTGLLNAVGGSSGYADENRHMLMAGRGRIRLDALDLRFYGTCAGEATSGFQPILFLPASGVASLGIRSVAGVLLDDPPLGHPLAPDVIVPARAAGSIPVVVACQNLPLNTVITVVAQGAAGSSVEASALNNAGTLESSTAVVEVDLPPGNGILFAKAVVTAGGGLASMGAEGGRTVHGEAITQVEIRAEPGRGLTRIGIAENGRRYPLTVP